MYPSPVARALGSASKCAKHSTARVKSFSKWLKLNSETCARRPYASSVRTVVQSPYSDVAIPQCSMPNYIWENFERWADRPAVECGITGKTYTYVEMRRMSLGFGCSLLKIGLKPREGVTVILPNMPEFPAVVLGALEANLVVSTVSPLYTEDEICHQMEDSESKCIVTTLEILPKALAVRAKLKDGIRIVCVDEGGVPEGIYPFAEMAKRGWEAGRHQQSIDINVDDTALLPYSSGTTGLPKGVCLSHRNVAGNIEQIGYSEISHIQPTTKDHQDTIPGILPFFHIYGLCVVMFQALRKGAKLVTLPRFEPTNFLKILENNKDIALHVAPPVILFLGSQPSVKQKHLENIRSAVTGGAPCGSADIERVQQKRRFTILQAYGMTEASPVVTFPPLTCTDISTIGPPVSNTLGKIVDIENSNDLPTGEIGELCFKGPQVMKGYHKKPEATADTVDKGGWLHTGDIGYFNKKGHFFVVDRLKELIKVKGFQVAPAELEAVLREHPNIFDAGVTAVPSDRMGEKPIAFVVTKPDVSSLDTEKVKEFVSKKVAPYKQLAKVYVIDKIPKSLAGKILRRELRKLANDMTNKQ